MEILDVGCGISPKGTVNVDLFRFSLETTGKKNVLIKTKANVIVAGEFLPFKDGCFERVVSFQVIEHSNNPIQFLKELIHVAIMGGKCFCHVLTVIALVRILVFIGVF